MSFLFITLIKFFLTMKPYFILFVPLIFILFLSCTNCSDSNKPIKNNTKDSINCSQHVDSVDSIDQVDSLTVNVFEVVDEERTDSDAGRPTEVNVSKRGEMTIQKVNDDFALQGNGIGVVRIGSDITKLPASYKGLYDKKNLEGGELLFYKAKELILEVTYNKNNKLINSIRVTSPTIKTEDGISQFMTFDALMKIEKAKKAIGKKNKFNLESFNIDGITYEMEENIEGDKYVSAIIIK